MKLEKSLLIVVNYDSFCVFELFLSVINKLRKLRILFLVNCETINLLCVKRDLDPPPPPFTSLIVQDVVSLF